MSLSHGNKKSISSHGGNADCIFALRQINKYAGPILKIRRNSDDATQLFYFSNSLYGINEQEILDFVNGSNGFVETWYDQSGNSKHASNVTPSGQPRIVANGVMEKKNGRPTIVFSGSQTLGVTTTVFGTSFGVFQRNTTAMVVSQAGSGNYRGVFPGVADDAFWTHSDYATNGGSLVNISTTSSPLSSISGSNLFQASGIGTPNSQPIQLRAHTLGFGTPGYAPLIGCISEILAFPTDIRNKRSYIEDDQMEYYNI